MKKNGKTLQVIVENNNDFKKLFSIVSNIEQSVLGKNFSECLAEKKRKYVNTKNIFITIFNSVNNRSICAIEGNSYVERNVVMFIESLKDVGYTIRSTMEKLKALKKGTMFKNEGKLNKISEIIIDASVKLSRHMPLFVERIVASKKPKQSSMSMYPKLLSVRSNDNKRNLDILKKSNPKSWIFNNIENSFFTNIASKKLNKESVVTTLSYAVRNMIQMSKVIDRYQEEEDRRRHNLSANETVQNLIGTSSGFRHDVEFGFNPETERLRELVRDAQSIRNGLENPHIRQRSTDRNTAGSYVRYDTNTDHFQVMIDEVRMVIEDTPDDNVDIPRAI